MRELTLADQHVSPGDALSMRKETGGLRMGKPVVLSKNVWLLKPRSDETYSLNKETYA